ncbi:LOW QUALITY PROTEIN: E3 ubiquitin-protein ligase TRIM65-like [Podargus strigoides]
MASPISQKLEEKLVCSICLQLFKLPAILPCRHNFCKCCISDQWHKQEQVPPGLRRAEGALGSLELEKNVTLCSVVELVWEGEVQVSGTERCEVVSGELCPQHGSVVELYYEDNLVLESSEGSWGRGGSSMLHCRALVPPFAGPFDRVPGKSPGGSGEDQAGDAGAGGADVSIKGSLERLKAATVSKFTLLKEALEDCQWQTVARIEEQAAVLGLMEEDWSLLKDHLDILSQHRERAQRLLASPDHRTFLQEFPLLPSPESPEALLPMELVVKSVAEILTDISRLLLEDLPGSVAPKAAHPVGQDPVHPQGLAVKVVAPLPECQLRAELLKDHCNLTFDPETANKYLELSKDNWKAKHGPSAVCGWQEQGCCFEPWQVLCTQGYSCGHHYWEVKVSSHAVILGVTYCSLPQEKQQGHKFNTGLDEGSWGLQVWEDWYPAWHEGRVEKIQERLYKNLGVSLDYGKGLLSFCGFGERTRLIHSFHRVFTEPLYPVFWPCEGRAVTLCWRD